MNHSPYSTSPDALDLTIPIAAQDITYRYFESEWGMTDELLCYYLGTLIGIVVRGADPAFSRNDTITIHLLPKLNARREYEWPSHAEFTTAIRSLLERPISWSLWCERDCDQYPVEVIEDDVPCAFGELEKALRYSLGEPYECPSFSARVVVNG